MRWAIKTAPQMTTWRAVLDTWVAADDAEVFESAWSFDHFEPILGLPRSGPCLEGWTSLAALAQATERIRVGLMVTGMPYRHPSVLANMAATVDVVSGGRLELGLGAGWNAAESEALGIDLPPLRERFDRFDEGCEVVVRLLSLDDGEQASFEGRHHRLAGAWCSPPPVQRPHPPITIGGGGERRTLRAVARHAQRWNLPSATPEVLEHKRAVLAERCAEIGRDPSSIDVTVQVRFAGDPEATVAEALALEPAGCRLVVVTLPPEHHTPAAVRSLAVAIGQP